MRQNNDIGTTESLQTLLLKGSLLLLVLLVFSCKNEQSQKAPAKAPEGMIWIKGKTFLQGAKTKDAYAMPREKPAHQVTVDGFYVDITEVTNAQFKKFVDQTNYITIAERAIDWQTLKKVLPPGTPKPPDSLLQPSSLVFNRNAQEVATMENYAQWWVLKRGADWKHPEGPESSIDGKDDYPVVHVAYEDALAYCSWANRRLPTEAEWEAAALGDGQEYIYTWGNTIEGLDQKANTWQGVFPSTNESKDGYEYSAPVKSFPPNTIGLYDLLGNVWEMTSDLYHVNYYKQLDLKGEIKNPQGAKESYSPTNPYQVERVIKGGSFLCNASYCASFRISARMGMALDSGSDHIGFRTVATPEMIQSQEER